jgi:hypothetical protein
MKKVYVLLIILAVYNNVHGQVVHDDSNNKVQIGSKLFLQYGSESANSWIRGFLGSSIKWNYSTDEWDVGVNAQSDFSMMQFSNGGHITFYTGAGTGSNYSMSNGSLSGYARMFIGASGKVGIGTITPIDKLHVVSSSEDITWPIVANNMYNSSTKDGYGVGIKLKHSHDNEDWKWSGIASVNEGGWANDSGLALYSDGSEKVRIKHDGSVGIGTINTFGYRLAVNGAIGAKEVNVEVTSDWPDFVFSDTYELRSLEEVDRYISQNKHLPAIPSEAEVREYGINLGEMNAKLLQKIEELTLYLIEQNKQNQSQQAEIAALKERVNQLEDQ